MGRRTKRSAAAIRMLQGKRIFGIQASSLISRANNWIRLIPFTTMLVCTVPIPPSGLTVARLLRSDCQCPRLGQLRQ